jgi:hypothetical protein
LSGRRTIAVEDFAEVAEVDGFGQMIVHAGLQAGFAVGGKGVAVRAMTGVWRGRFRGGAVRG